MICALCVACASVSFNEHVYRDGRVAFRVGTLPAGWRRVALGGDGLVFHNEQGGLVSSRAWCPARGVDDVPLNVLTNQVLIGFTDRRERSRVPLILDGRGALRTRLTGKLDGVAVALDLVVIKKDGCTYDLQCIADPAVISQREADFDILLRGFAVLDQR